MSYDSRKYGTEHYGEGEFDAFGRDGTRNPDVKAVTIRDERRPREIAQIKLEVNEREHCDDIAADDANYSIHYSGVDDEQETSRLFYSYYTAGLRVFDVSNPARPAEVGYYHPAPKPSTVLPALAPGLGDFHRPTWDAVTSVVRYRPESAQLWVAGFAGGLNVVELTGAARPDPRLALSRRCARAGRLWARLLARDLAAVRRVDFKLGSRLVRRDPRAPFTATVGPRMLQRARTRSLRAVVQLRDSARARAVLRRTLPRCVR